MGKGGKRKARNSPIRKMIRIAGVLFAAGVTILFSVYAYRGWFKETEKQAREKAAEPPESRAAAPASSLEKNADVPAPPTDGDEESSLFKDREFFIQKLTVKGSLPASVLAAMPDNTRLAKALSSAAEDVLRYRMDARTKIGEGDAATLVFKEAPNAAVRLYGLRYESKLLGKILHAYFFWEKGKDYPEYFDADGTALRTRMKMTPVRQYERIGRVLSRDGNGIDFITGAGADVISPLAAAVERINWLPKEQGSCVEVKYAGTGVYASFTRLDGLSVHVNPGAEVAAGGVIGRAGYLGEGKGFGVRYELHSAPGDDAPHIDPFEFHKTETYRLPESSRGTFQVVRTKIDLMFEKAAK